MAVNKPTSKIDYTSQEIDNLGFDGDFGVPVSEIVKLNPANTTKNASIDRDITDALALRVAVDSGDTNVQYVGEARIGTTTSEAKWRIQKINKTTGTVITWADGDGEFDNIWDNRESLSYS